VKTYTNKGTSYIIGWKNIGGGLDKKVVGCGGFGGGLEK
jgi:hypothetical protein